MSDEEAKKLARDVHGAMLIANPLDGDVRHNLAVIAKALQAAHQSGYWRGYSSAVNG